MTTKEKTIILRRNRYTNKVHFWTIGNTAYPIPLEGGGGQDVIDIRQTESNGCNS